MRKVKKQLVSFSSGVSQKSGPENFGKLTRAEP